MAALVKARSEKRAARRAGEAGKRIEYLAFVLAGETYAVQIAHVAEILRLPLITEVPRAPNTVLGVISVRGKLVTVVDLRRRFRLPETPMDRKTRVLLADAGGGEQIGLLVDEVQQVWRLAMEEIEPAHVLGGDQPAHIAGIARPAGSGGAILILLELRPILEIS
ncbi:MAG TPA: chemotaxis protein CheW [Polyangiaceae bacterium]|jgi:purine-binding chemotaxis protein CheW